MRRWGRAPESWPRRPQTPEGDPEVDYTRLLEFRTGLRQFLRWSDRAAKEAGITPAQHQLLLAVRGHPDQHSWLGVHQSLGPRAASLPLRGCRCPRRRVHPVDCRPPSPPAGACSPGLEAPRPRFGRRAALAPRWIRGVRCPAMARTRCRRRHRTDPSGRIRESLWCFRVAASRERRHPDRRSAEDRRADTDRNLDRRTQQPGTGFNWGVRERMIT